MSWDWLKTYYMSVIIMAVAAVVTVSFPFLKPPKPFNAEITSGSPVINSIDGLLSLTIGIIVTNTGELPGCIADVALSVESKTSKTRWPFFPAWFVDMNSYLQGIPEKRDIMSSVNGSFSSISLPAGSSQRYALFFMPRPITSPKVAPLRNKDLIPGDTYIMEIYILKGGDACVISQSEKWVKAGKTDFILTNEHIKALSEGEGVITIGSVRDGMREKFIRR